MRTLRSWRTCTLPAMMSPIPGIVRYGTPEATHNSTIRRICAPVAEGMAIRISSTFCSCANAGISSIRPTTSTSWMRWARLWAASSTMPTIR